MQNVDFHYQISDEQLIAYSHIALLDRLKWLDNMRRFTLAARAAPAVRKPKPQVKAATRQRGLTLIELIIFIVIVSVGLVGILSVLNVTVRSSADPMIRKQMLAIAEGLLEEVTLQSFTWCDPDDPAAATATQYLDCPAATRQNSASAKSGESRGSSTFPLDNVFDYNGLTDITNSVSGTPATVMPAGYSASITVAQAALSTVDAASSLLVTITVCHATACPRAGADSIVLEGYRTRHSPNLLP